MRIFSSITTSLTIKEKRKKGKATNNKTALKTFWTFVYFVVSQALNFYCLSSVLSNVLCCV